MPQIDLSPLFTPPAKSDVTPAAKPDSSSDASSPPPPRSICGLNGPQWTNVAFVTAACVGALLSAAYLFKGGELLQEVAAWPRELFMGRPVALAQQAGEPATNPGNGIVASAPISGEPNESGDPFSSTDILLRLDRTALSTAPNGRVTSRSKPGMSFRLDPGGRDSNGADALSGTLFNGAEVQQAAPAVGGTASQAAQGVASNAEQSAIAPAKAAIAPAGSAAHNIGTRRSSANMRAANRVSSGPVAPHSSVFQRALTAIARSLRADRVDAPKVAHTQAITGSLQARLRSVASALNRRTMARRNAAVARRDVVKQAPARIATKARLSQKNSTSRRGVASGAATPEMRTAVRQQTSSVAPAAARSSVTAPGRQSAAGFRSLGTLGTGHGVVSPAGRGMGFGAGRGGR